MHYSQFMGNLAVTKLDFESIEMVFHSQRPPASAFADSKSHYAILDGLRGVAAVMVVIFHLFEAFATSHVDQRINHGYLAVDFFFILSGFVIAYSYDDRWRTGATSTKRRRCAAAGSTAGAASAAGGGTAAACGGAGGADAACGGGGLTVWEFIKRRLIRLQPMVVLGALIGGALFYLQRCEVWDVSAVSAGALIVAVLMNALLLPAPIGVEVRGLTEMYPLNGPSWSLLFEYIGNISYALILRRLATGTLTLFVTAAAIGLALYAIAGPLGDICVGFAMDWTNISGGLLRLFFAFSAGLLLNRLCCAPADGTSAAKGASAAAGAPVVGALADGASAAEGASEAGISVVGTSADGTSAAEGSSAAELRAEMKCAVVGIGKRIGEKMGKGIFAVSSMLLILLFALPRLGGYEKLWLNGIYDSICVIIIFPAIVFSSALGSRHSQHSRHFCGEKVCTFLGDISYPLYMVHYPFIYLYYAWVKNGELTFQQSLPGAIALLVGCIALAWISLKLYDIPVRRYLTRWSLSDMNKRTLSGRK